MLETGLTTLEAIVVFAVVATIGNFRHYTWWAVTAYGGFLVAAAAGRRAETWVLAFVIQAMVISGVAVMSLLQCHMLQDAADVNGPAVYLVGNFFLHYWPCIGTLLRAGKPVCEETQGSLALLLFLVYTALWHPNAVYGCAVSYNAVILGATTSGLLATAVAVRYDCIFGDGCAV